MLGLKQQHLSQMEHGHRPVSLEQRRLIVTELGIVAEDLGLSSGHTRGLVSRDDANPEIAASRLRWRAERRWLNHHRSELARLAVQLYPAEQRVTRTPLIAAPDWQPAEPIELRSLTLELDETPQTAAVEGSEPESEPTRPLRTAGAHFERYTSAIKHLGPPALFESRPSYRLLNASLGAGQLGFGLAAYFDKLDVAETLGHELAAACMNYGVPASRRPGVTVCASGLAAVPGPGRRSVRPGTTGDHSSDHHVDDPVAPVPGRADVSVALARSGEGGHSGWDLRRDPGWGVPAVQRGAVGSAQRLRPVAQHRARIRRGAARRARARRHPQPAHRLRRLDAVPAARAGACGWRGDVIRARARS